MAHVQHPAVVPVLGTVEEGGAEGALMPFDGRPSLQDVLRQGRVDRGTARRWAATLADALQWAHDSRVVHGALSPRRVWVDGSEVRLWGFGTGPDALVPDPGNQGPPTPDSDVFAWGALVYELLTGVPPFPGTAKDRAARAAAGAFTPLAVACPELPPSIAALLYAALSPVPASRPARLPEGFDEEWPDTAETLGRPSPPTIVAFERSGSESEPAYSPRPLPLARVEYVPPREASLTEPLSRPRLLEEEEEFPPWVRRLAVAATVATIALVVLVIALVLATG